MTYRGNKKPHLCIVRRSLWSCTDGRGGIRKGSANATIFIERTEAGDRILINDFSRLGLIEGRVCRLPIVTIRAGAPTGAASISAPTTFRKHLNCKRTVLHMG